MGEKKTYKKTSLKNKKVKEPVSLYKKTKITVFNSFEEMNEYDIEEMAKSTARKRFENITYLIQQQYSEELKKPFPFSILSFK